MQPPCFSQRNTSRIAIEEPSSKPLFQSADTGGRETNGVAGLGKAAGLNNRLEKTDRRVNARRMP